MNIAIPTLLIVLLVLPGMLFRRFYYSAEFSRQYFKSSFADLVLWAFVPALIIHATVFFLWAQPKYTIDHEVIAVLISGTDNPSQYQHVLPVLTKSAKSLATFYFITLLLAGFSGILFRVFVRKTKLDRRWSLLRFPNEWHYTFSGEYLDFPGQPGSSSEIECCYVDVLCGSGKEAIIYTGILEQYYLNSNQGIDRIALSRVKRRRLEDDPNTGFSDGTNAAKYYHMPGKLFVISYQEVTNLNLTFYSATYTRPST